MPSRRERLCICCKKLLPASTVQRHEAKYWSERAFEADVAVPTLYSLGNPPSSPLIPSDEDETKGRSSLFPSSPIRVDDEEPNNDARDADCNGPAPDEDGTQFDHFDNPNPAQPPALDNSHILHDRESSPLPPNPAGSSAPLDIDTEMEVPDTDSNPIGVPNEEELANQLSESPSSSRSSSPDSFCSSSDEFDMDSDSSAEDNPGFSERLPAPLPLGSDWELSAARLRRNTPMDQGNFELLKAYNYQSKTHMGAGAFKIWISEYPKDGVPSLKALTRSMKDLGGLAFKSYDCCRNSCICYVGAYKDATQCPTCQLPRNRPNGKPYNQFRHLPIVPQLRAAYCNPSLAKAMRHRSEAQDAHLHDPEKTITDIYHSAFVQRLRRCQVEVNGRVLPYKYLEDDRDVLLVMMTDGFQIFKRGKHTAWPLIFVNTNLPPTMRYKLANIICAGVIPGPKKPKDFGSFMYVIAEELARSALGEVTYDAFEDKEFTLRVYCPFGSGDMPAGDCAYTEGKGANGISPCRWCEIHAVPITGSSNPVHYVPIKRPPGYPPHEPALSSSNLPLRTHDRYLQQAREVDTAPTNQQAALLARRYGIKGTPMTSRIPGVRYPDSFPWDFMHILENLFKNYASLIGGDFKGLNSNQPYVIPAPEWSRIGAATVIANKTIPSAFGRSIPNIAEDRTFFTAEAYLVWFTLYAPILLRNSFSHPKYYKHLLSLLSIITRCLSFRSTDDGRKQLRRDIVSWYDKYEQFFYQYKKERLPTCVLTIHGWLHLVDLIERSGPLWAYWCWVMERFCGRLGRSVKSRKHPYSSLNKRILEVAQITAVTNMYRLPEELTLDGPARQPTTGTRDTFIGYPDLILHHPRRVIAFDESVQDLRHLRRNIAAHLATQWNVRVATIENLLPESIVQYAKVELVDGDVIHSEFGHRRREENEREASHLQYELRVDRNARHRNAPVVLESATFYGRLERVFVCTVPPAAELLFTTPKTLVLCAVRPCNGAEDQYGFFEYHDYRSGFEVIDGDSVRASVGRIFEGGKWVIVKREGNIEHADYVADV